MIAEFLSRLRFLVFRKKGSELDDEIRFHLEQSIAAKISAGVSGSEARRQALVEFGGLQLAREECERQRPGWWIGAILQDLRYGVRRIMGQRWFSAAIVVTLALGIGLNTMVFTLVNAVLFKPVPVPGGARLVSVQNRMLSRDDRSVLISLPDFRDYRAQSAGFEFLEATEDEQAVLIENDNPAVEYHLSRATSGIFSMVQGKALIGRAFLPSDESAGAEPVVVIGYKVWQERYAGASNVLGRRVRVNDEPATIVGVMPKGFKFPNKSDLWMPLVATADLAKRDNRVLRGYGILKRGITIREANAELNGIAARLVAHFPEDKDIGVSVLSFNQRVNGGQIRIVFLLMLAAVGFVLLIACADVANMMLSRSLSWQREMSIRTALGASRWRIISQLLMESVVLSTLGGVLGLGLASGGIHWFDLSTAFVRPYWIEFTPDFSVFGYFAALCILSGLLFGIAPALRSSKLNIVDVLKEGARSAGRRKGGWLSSVLVVFQFALTLVLLTGAGMFVRSLMRNISVNPFVPAAELTSARIALPQKRYKDKDARQHFFDQLLPRLRAIPGVSHAAIVSDAPGLGTVQQQIELEHFEVQNPAQRRSVSLVAASPGYFETVRLPILSGRDFGELDGAPHRESAILTREAAGKLWPGQDPIGKRFRLFDGDKKPTEWITVVGISADMVQDIQESDPKPLLFVPYRQEGWDNMGLLVESIVDPLASMRSAVQKIDPELALMEASRLDEAMYQHVWFLSVFGKIFFGFAFIAMVMASVGLYSVIAHATSSRTQEIGVRIALGASVQSILLLVMKRGLWQIAIGLAIGLAGALPLAHIMNALPFGPSQSDSLMFLVIATSLAAVGIFACWVPARHAAGLDPVKAIRYE